MDIETKILIAVGLLIGTYFIGYRTGTAHMYRVYGDVMSAEALMYLAHKDNEA